MKSLFSTAWYYYYRTTTVIQAVVALFTLSEKDLQAFFESYVIYDHDWANKEEMIKAFGPNYTEEVGKRLIDYYSVLNYLCAIGEVEKMYIPPVMDLKQSLTQNQVLFERKMCSDLGIKKTDKVLDIGCGRGRVANHVHELTGAKVYGFNIDPTQLNFAKLYTDSRGNDCHFQRWDINSLPFPYEDNFFDAIYHIQVFSLSQDLTLLFKEINRILKPGGKVSCLDWVVLDKYDKTNKDHVSLMKRVKPLIGAIGCPHNKEYAAAMESAGFELIIDANASVGGFQYQLIDNADSYYATVEKWIKFLCKYKIFPAYFERLFERFTLDGQAFVEMDKKELCTSCYHFVGKKKEVAARN